MGEMADEEFMRCMDAESIFGCDEEEGMRNWRRGEHLGSNNEDAWEHCTRGFWTRRLPSIKGKWVDGKGDLHTIDTMKTNHIINCMKLLERKMWGTVSKMTRSDLETRKVTGAACGQLDKYREFEAELMKRIKDKKVTLGDFFIAIRTKNVRVIR